jgi:hypothetical protein
MLPEATKFQCNENTCTLVENNANGIGNGRNYNVGNGNGSVNGELLANGNGVSTETFQNYKMRY